MYRKHCMAIERSPIYQRLTLFILFLLSFCNTVMATALLPDVDLEEVFQDSIVVASKQVTIPGHPNAFNPAVVSWNGKLLMSFRDIPNAKEKYTSYIGLVWLDSQFNPVGIPQILETRDATNPAPSRAEDARLIVVGEKLYIIYSDNPLVKINRAGFRVYVAEVRWNGQRFSLHNKDYLTEFDGRDDNAREKNWVPFDYKGTLFLAYSISPHLIFRPLLGTGSCETYTSTLSDIRWPWGILRGGTPGILEGGEYLSFFHSSKEMPSKHTNGKKVLHYFMGAYAFSAKPPFAITRISSKPIVGKNFYHGQEYVPYWKPVKVVFPCGYVSHGEFIWIAYGRDDREVWVAKISKKALFNSMVPVTSIPLDIVRR